MTNQTKPNQTKPNNNLTFGLAVRPFFHSFQRSAFSAGRFFICAAIMLAAGALLAEVPNRLTYQGRLARRGVSVSGDHIFVARILDQDGKALWSSGNITQKLPITGDFALILEPTGIDWLNVKPSLEISIDGEKFTPNEPFAASPYANAAAIAATVPDGAITNTKLASNLSLSPEKVSITGSTTLNDWRSTDEGFTHKINAGMIRGNIASDYTQVTGTAVVCTADRMQTIRPTAGVTPLVVQNYNTDTVSDIFVAKIQNGDNALVVTSNSDATGSGGLNMSWTKSASGIPPFQIVNFIIYAGR